MINRINGKDNLNRPVIIRNVGILTLWIGITLVGIWATVLIPFPDIFTKASGSMASSNDDDNTNSNATKSIERDTHDPDTVVTKMEAAFGKPFYELTDSKSMFRISWQYIVINRIISIPNFTDLKNGLSSYKIICP